MLRIVEYKHGGLQMSEDKGGYLVLLESIVISLTWSAVGSGA